MGAWITVHSVLMVVAGLVFGYGVVRAGVFPRWTGALLMLGMLSMVVATALPDVVQTAAAAIRDIALRAWARHSLALTAGKGREISVPQVGRDQSGSGGSLPGDDLIPTVASHERSRSMTARTRRPGCSRLRDTPTRGRGLELADPKYWRTIRLYNRHAPFGRSRAPDKLPAVMPDEPVGEHDVRTVSRASGVSAVVRAGWLPVVLVAAFATGCGGHGRALGTIVFESGYSDREALYAVHPDGSRLTKLLDLPQEADVFWTRDGTKALLFDYGPTAFVFEPASRSRRNIRLPGFDPPIEVAPWSDMLWSPDGRRLAYATDDGDIVVLGVGSGVRRRITEGSSDGPVAWSPDGRRVLFIDYSDGAVYTAPAGGGGRVRLLRLPADVDPDALPQWSADGKWISLFNIRGSPAKLYVARADGKRFHSIVRNAQDAAWSPTGERVAFAGDRGIVVVDLEHARRRQLTRDPLDSSLAWSPDGERIAYARNDLGRGAPGDHHMQLWTMKADGTDQRPVTHVFPDDGSNGPAVWVGGFVNGTPVPRLPLVSLHGARTIATRLPIVALAAAGNRAVVAQGLGGPPDFRGPLGPIVLWNPVRNSSVRIPIPGCGRAYDVLLDGVIFSAGGVVYRCDNSGVAYSTDDTLRLVRPGKRGTIEIVHTQGEEFSGSLLGGLAGDRTAIAFDVGAITVDRRGDVRIGLSHIWKVTEARKAIVRTFPGEATVVSLDAGRIAVLRDGKAVSVLSPDGRLRTFAFGGSRVLGAALDGPRLLVLQSTRLTEAPMTCQVISGSCCSSSR